VAFTSLFEDQAFLTKLYLEQATYLLPECLARYRMHRASTFGARGRKRAPGRRQLSDSQPRVGGLAIKLRSGEASIGAGDHRAVGA